LFLHQTANCLHSWFFLFFSILDFAYYGTGVNVEFFTDIQWLVSLYLPDCCSLLRRFLTFQVT